MAERTFSFLGGGEPSTPGASPELDTDAFLGAVKLGSDGGDSGSSGGSGGGDRDSAGTIFDPDLHSGGTNGDGTWRKKRGRKAGATSTNRSNSKASHTASLDALTNTLKVVHLAIAGVAKFDDFALEDSEAKSLATAVNIVLQEFDITPDPKVQAVVNLIIAGSAIYGPRVYLYREHLKAKQAEKKRPPVSEILPFGPVGTTTQ